ncbi:MAG: IPT/TIG domain-containing protein [Acidobacteria bacterium]|nr:IPT/TIG domain-containing protein [Acidobacteriota bacterium]
MTRKTTSIQRVQIKPRPTITGAILGVALLLTTLVFLPGVIRIFRVRAATVIQNSVPVTSVSAASFVGAPAPLAPDSIVAAFGTDLATGTQLATAQPLPTMLLGTTVTVNGTAAPLFFVSPGQINFLVPPSTTAGEVQVVVTSTLGNGDQIVSRGQMVIAGSAPAIFTANANGTGAPAAVTGRVNGNGQFVFDPTPPFEPDPVNPSQVVPAPIDVGTAQQPAFLILYGTGLRSAPAGSVRAIIGGIEVPVAPVAAPGFTGLDQINLQIPESLKGKGNVSINLVANGLSSNTITVKMAGASAGNLSISGFNVTGPALAGQTVTINGNGFSATTNENIVRIGNAQARVVSASPSQLNVIVPFGAESGLVTVQTLQGEARSASPFLVRTSVSGIVQSTGGTNTQPQPLENVTIRVVGTNLSVRTNPQGSFVLSDIPAGVNLIEIEGGTNPTNPPFPSVSLKAIVRSGRDNQFSQPISLQQITGGSGTVGGGGSGFTAEALARMVGKSASPNSRLADAFRKFAPGTGKQGPRAKAQVIGPGNNVNVSNRGVNLDIPFSTTVRFPDGKTSGSIQLTVVEGSRLPGIELPKGVYSTAIAQITPFGTTFSPGASLQFPNPDLNNLPPGSKLDLYRYDSTAGIFVKRGTATVTADGANVTSDGRIIDVASFWFVASPSGITTVTGRVIDLLGLPVPGAIVSVNGRSNTSDQNGGFSIADVSTTGSAQLQAEAVIPQQFGTPPRGVSSLTDIVTGGITNVGTIALSDTQQPGLVLAPFMIDFDSNSPPARVEVTLTQPAPAGGLQVSLTSDEVTVATAPANVTIPAGQTTASFDITRVGPGYAFIDATATLANATLESFAIVTVSSVAPVLTSVTPQSGSPRATITITGTGLSPFPDLNLIGFIRDGELIAIVDPFDISVVPGPTGAPAVTAIVPPIGPGPAGIVVAVIDDVNGVISDDSAPLAFTVLQSNVPTPQLTAVTPASGNPRDQITITGSNFGSTPDENLIIFLQNGIESYATVLQASASQLVVQVPGYGLIKGPATIIARRIDQDGIEGNNSNALDFTINSDPVAPPNPVLTSVINVATQMPAGKAGDTIQITGTGLGRNFLDLQTGDFGNSAPDLSLVYISQNGNPADIAFPFGAQAGTQITTFVPAGLSAGVIQISVITIDFETGLATEQSNNIDFMITESSLQQIDESEPNDTYDESLVVTPGTIVTGAIAVGDRGGTSIGGITIDFTDGTSEDLGDLFYLLLDNQTTISIILNFTDTADLDLFILREDGQGGYEIVDSSTNIDTTVEQLIVNLPPDEYLIGVGAYSGSSDYTLTIVEGQVSLSPSGSIRDLRSRLPMRAVRRKFQVRGSFQ